MNDYKTLGIIRDVLLLILIVFPFTFIDTSTALFVGVTGTSILLIWRNIHHSNSQHTNGHVISGQGKELALPKGVEMFQLSDSAPMEILYKYIEVLGEAAIHPEILIIRFKQIRQINPIEANVLDEVLIKLSKRGIKTIFSEVDAHLKSQLKKYTLAQKVGENNIFHSVVDALSRAKKMLNLQ